MSPSLMPGSSPSAMLLWDSKMTWPSCCGSGPQNFIRRPGGTVVAQRAAVHLPGRAVGKFPNGRHFPVNEGGVTRIGEVGEGVNV